MTRNEQECSRDAAIEMSRDGRFQGSRGNLESRQRELQAEITELRRTCRELQASRDRYAELYHTAAVGCLTVNARGRIVDANRTAAAMLQTDCDALKNLPLERIVVARHRHTSSACLHEAFTEARHSCCDVRIIRKHGNPFWGQIDIQPEDIGEAGERCFRIAITDIGGRKRSEHDHRRDREMLAGIIDTIPIMIAIYDPELKSFRFNREFRRVLGWTEEDAATGDFMVKAYPDPAYRQRVSEYMRAAETGWQDFTVVAKDGTCVESSWSNVRLSDDTWIGIGIDVRERRAAQRRLEELNRTLEQRVARRTDQLEATVKQLRKEATLRDQAETVLRKRSEMLHELNTQLEQRAGQLESLTLQLSEAEERQRRQLSEVLHDDLQQVLAGAKYQLGLLPERVRQGVDLTEACDAIAELVTQAIRQSRSLSHELNPPGLADGCLSAALRWLGQEMHRLHGLCVDIDATEGDDPGDESTRVFSFRAIQELLFNVVKHAATDHARVAVHRGDGRLHVTVADNGCGFDVASMEGDAASVTGVGLKTIRERAAMLGGALRITSGSGSGSTFRLSLPCSR